ncbi:MAG: hypothetical protein ACOX8H_00280 [Ruminococcus sp.]|jgi:uncharacterized protein YneF (UPF0154 family)
MTEGKKFIGYEYKEITVPADQVSMYLDCYENFGWIVDEKAYVLKKQKKVQEQHRQTVRLKRNRKIMNKMELTRLQRNFESCAHEIEVLEEEKTRMPMIQALTVGIAGTAFMAGSTFAVVHEPPLIGLCILLAIPGFLGWILPYFLYRRMTEKKRKKLEPLIEDKLEEIYSICQKGHALL